MSEIRLRPGARHDLVQAVAFLASRSERTARRFRAEAEATIARLASRPGLGARYDPDDPGLSELRLFPIARYPAYLVFYLALSDGVDVVRVLHGARDLPALLAEDLSLSEPDDAGPT